MPDDRQRLRDLAERIDELQRELCAVGDAEGAGVCVVSVRVLVLDDDDPDPREVVVIASGELADEVAAALAIVARRYGPNSRRPKFSSN